MLSVGGYPRTLAAGDIAWFVDERVSEGTGNFAHSSESLAAS